MPSPTTAPDHAVAVVGMACRLPGAHDIRAFWSLLRDGRDSISRPERAELLGRGADPDYVGRENFVAAMGVLADSRRFDWSFFRYSRAEAAAMDPQQRVFLECAATAVDDAGLDPVRFPGRVGVYAGADRFGPGRDDASLSELARYIGREKDFVATRVAYKLGLRGPAVTVQTACSTSLTAVHLAVRALLGGECDAALAGGVTVMPDGEWGYLFEPGGILAPDGVCRPFDAEGAGTVPSEGVGVVVLKRLADALRDGDRIASVIAGTALNNDGAEKMAYTAPSATGQAEVIRAALAHAGLASTAVDYVEAHGTATRLGDPIEVQALTEAFGTADRTGPCLLGAVKGNVGHTGAAAGVVGLIKTVLMLERRELVPTVHHREPNPLLELDRSPFEVVTAHRPWPLREGQDRRVGAVSSFGVGGTNAHVVLTEAPVCSASAASEGPQLLALSAATTGALARLDEELVDRFVEQEQGAEEPVSPASAALTLAARRRHRYRRAVVVHDAAHAAKALAAEADRLTDRVDATAEPGRLGQVAFLFPGQGTLRHAAGEAAHRLLPGFRAAFDEIRAVAADTCGVDLTPVVASTADEDWFADAVHQQLGLLALGLGFARQLGTWGVTPRAMLGNSIGEYAAAAHAGVWTLPDAVRVVHHRARAMREAEPGAMAVVGAPPDEVAARLPADCGVVVAVRSHRTAVLSGSRPDLAELLAGEALHGLRITPVHTRRAFHSPAMNSAAEALRDHLSSMPARTPRLPYISNTTGGPADPQTAATPGYWATHLREPVRLDAGVDTLLASGCTTFLELGPGGSMTGSLRAAPGWDAAWRTLRLAPGGPGDGESVLLEAVGALWELGLDAALDTVLGARFPDPANRPRRCSLPAHPFLGEDPSLTAAAPPAPARPAPAEVPEPRRPRPAGRHRDMLAEVWCRTLGVAEAVDADDFHALGGDSLSALALMTSVRERLGVDVSVAEFTRDPGFGRLVELVERHLPDATGQSVASMPVSPFGTVVLREGTGRPFFLLTDAGGSALPYRALAGLLGGESPESTHHRPVLALEQPAWTERQGARSIAAIAAAQVAALLRAQPAGPLTLGGWSFGAVVAHEAARQLSAHGREVDLLVALDGFVPDTGRLPVAAAPDFLLGGLRAGVDAALGTGPLVGLHRRSPELRRRFLAGQAAVLGYRPRAVACPAVLLKADSNAAQAERLRRRLSALYPAGLRVVPVAGDHWSMLTQPHVGGTAARVREALEAVDAPPCAAPEAVTPDTATSKERKII